MVSYVFHVLNAMPRHLLTNMLYSHFQESGNSTTYRTEDLEKIILETFEFLSRCFYIQREQIRQFPRERLTVIEPIFLDVGSIYSNTIPIPSVFYQSKQVTMISKHRRVFATNIVLDIARAHANCLSTKALATEAYPRRIRFAR